MKAKDTWERTFKPHAEFVGFLTKPQMYKIYAEEEEKRKRLESLKDGHEVTIDSQSSLSGSGIANSHFDQDKGLVDEKGNVIIPKEQYEKMMGLSGVAVSF